jgi:transposase InsO family protein
MMILSPGSAAAFYLVKPPVHAFEVATSHAAIGPVHRGEGCCAWSPAWARAHKMIVRLATIRDAHTALAMIESWIEDYNSVHPHSRLGYRHQESILVPNLNPPCVRSNESTARSRHIIPSDCDARSE